jgi:hypothetical protein
MKFNLTFNKPAVTQFIDPAQHAGIRVKVDGKQIMFKPSKKATGADVFAISERTRGGTGITISGKFADAFLKATGLERGSHMTLAQANYGWLVAEPLSAPGEKPSKIIPTARLWRAVEEMGEKAEKAPAAPVRKPRVAKKAVAEAGRVPAKRGRKSNAQKAAEAAAAAKPKRGRKPNAQKAAEAATATA